MGKVTMDVRVEILKTVLLQVFQNKQITHDQFDCISHCLNDVIREGNDDQKKLACRYVLVIRTNLPFNSDARNSLTELEKLFRLSCAPLLNSLSAFIPNEYAVADLEDPDTESDPEDSPAGSPVPF